MPQVPVPKYRKAEKITSLPGVRLSADAPASAFGPDFRPVAQDVAQIAQREQKKTNQIAVMDADRQLGEFENARIYHPEKGAINVRGKDSFGLPEQVMADFDKVSGEIINGLGNDDQKLAFRQYVESRRRDIDRSLQRHVAGEMKKYDDEATESLVANELQAAVFNYQDPERIAHSIERIEYHYTQYAARNGLPTEWAKRKVTETVSKTHTGVVNRFLANDDDRLASAYYKANKAEVTNAADVTHIENALKEGSLRGESQRQADAIVAEHAQDADRSEAMKKAREITDPKVRDAVETRVNAFFSNKKAAENERQEKAFLNATNIVDRTMDESKVPMSIWTGLTLGQRSALKEYAKHKREGTDPVLDHPTWVQFTFQTEQQLAAMTDAQFMEKYYPKLDKSHRDRGLEMMRSAREAARKGITDPKFATTVTFKDMVRLSLESSKIIEPGKQPSKWSDEQSRRYSVFENEAWRRVQQFEMSELGGKRPASRIEMQLIMDKMLIDKVFVDEWGRDPEVPGILVSPNDLGDVYVPIARVPAAIKIEAVNLAKSSGNIPQNMAQAQAEQILKSRIERAYAARLVGATRQEILDIIGGRK